MTAKSEVPGAIRALTILIPVVAVIQLPAVGYIIVGGQVEAGMNHDPVGWVMTWAGIVHFACIVISLIVIRALRRGERKARRTTTICVAVGFAVSAWACVIAAPSVPMLYAPAAAPWMYVLLPLPPLLPPLAILLLLWVGASMREHFTAASP
ncbi:hypothetical protein [Microbacterium sp. NPDC056052]|uniref:hypothetical protein n=1 Tax=Microbacterium sp. NPDC056052 TaxID=3345695 RepID=UPI0035E29AC1